MGGGGVSAGPVLTPPMLPLQPESTLKDVQTTWTSPISFTSSEPASETGLLGSVAVHVPWPVNVPLSVTVRPLRGKPQFE